MGYQFLESGFKFNWVPSNFSGDIILRASDAVGLFSSNQSWNVTVDSILPTIQHSLNSSILTISSSDNCNIASMQYRWETFDGQNFGWINSQNASISVPSSLNGSIIRAQVKATDVIGIRIIQQHHGLTQTVLCHIL